MKNKSYLIILLAGLLFAGCNDFLDVQPVSNVPVERFYTSQNEANGAVLGVYEALSAAYNGSYFPLTEVAADLAQASPTSLSAVTLEIANNNWTVTTGAFGGYWNDFYRMINRANAVIARVGAMPGTAIPPQTAARFVAEGKLLRALAYFNLVRGFGDVPLKTTESVSLDNQTLYGARTPQEQVYAQIIQDLEEAAPDLPLTVTGVNLGRATQGAARALLAEVYLHRGQYAEARQAALEVIQLNQYSLLPDFKNVINTKNGPEHILSAQYDLVVFPNGINRGAGPQGTYLLDGMSGFGEYTATPQFFTEYPKTYRQRFTVVDSLPTRPNGVLTRLVAGPAIAKYFDLTIPNGQANTNTRDNGLNFPILRYATVLLTFAEADFEVNGPTQQALGYLNAIRRRARTNEAGVQNTTVLPDLTLNQLTLEQILDERKYELAYEGYRRWDLLRRNRYLPALQAVGKQPGPEDVLFPIPQVQLDLNPNLEQNDNY